MPRKGKKSSRGGAPESQAHHPKVIVAVEKTAKAKKKNKAGNGPFSSPQFAPVSRSAQVHGSEPVITRMRDRTRVYHSEYLSDIVAPTPPANGVASAFSLVPIGSAPGDPTSGFMNPGNPVLFRWLSRMAVQFEGYEWRRLKIHYEPRCSSNVAGEILLGFDKDVGDGLPGSKAVIYSWGKLFKGGVPWQTVILEVSGPEILSKRRFVSDTYNNTDANGNTMDVKTYHSGSLVIALNSLVAAGLLGVAFIEYEVDLFEPQLNEKNSVAGAGGYFVAQAPGTATAAQPMGTSVNGSAACNFARPVGVSGKNAFEIAKPGLYQVMANSQGTGIGSSTLSLQNVTNDVGPSSLSVATVTALFDEVSTSAQTAAWFLKVFQAPAIFSWALSGLTSLTSAFLTITKLPDAAMPLNSLVYPQNFQTATLLPPSVPLVANPKVSGAPVFSRTGPTQEKRGAIPQDLAELRGQIMEIVDRRVALELDLRSRVDAPLRGSLGKEDLTDEDKARTCVAAFEAYAVSRAGSESVSRAGFEVDRGRSLVPPASHPTGTQTVKFLNVQAGHKTCSCRLCVELNAGSEGHYRVLVGHKACYCGPCQKLNPSFDYPDPLPALE